MDVRIETIDEIKVARIRHAGPYNLIGPCFERIFAWIAETGAVPARVFTMSWDNPDTVVPEKLRSDACIEVRTDDVPPEGIVLDRVTPGRCAVATHRGAYDGLPGTYRRLFTQWLPLSGEKPSGRPCMEIYLNSPLDTEPCELVTELLVPLMPPQGG